MDFLVSRSTHLVLLAFMRRRHRPPHDKEQETEREQGFEYENPHDFFPSIASLRNTKLFYAGLHRFDGRRNRAGSCRVHHRASAPADTGRYAARASARASTRVSTRSAGSGDREPCPRTGRMERVAGLE